MEDEFGESLSVSSSMMRQPLPASVDFDNISENSVQFVEDECVPVHLPESLEFADHGFHVPEFEDKPFDDDFQNISGSIPGVDSAGLKPRRGQERSSPAVVASNVGVGSSVVQEQVDLRNIDRMISDAQVHVAETSLKLPWELPCFETCFSSLLLHCQRLPTRCHLMRTLHVMCQQVSHRCQGICRELSTNRSFLRVLFHSNRDEREPCRM